MDISEDQFRFEPHPLKNDCPVYCGKPIDFYNLIELDPPRECDGTNSMNTDHKEREANDIICKYL